MSYLFGLYAIITVASGPNKYEYIQTFENRVKCEEVKAMMLYLYEPNLSNAGIELVCMKVDEA